MSSSETGTVEPDAMSFIRDLQDQLLAAIRMISRQQEEIIKLRVMVLSGHENASEWVDAQQKIMKMGAQQV